MDFLQIFSKCEIQPTFDHDTFLDRLNPLSASLDWLHQDLCLWKTGGTHCSTGKQHEETMGYIKVFKAFLKKQCWAHWLFSDDSKCWFAARENSNCHFEQPVAWFFGKKQQEENQDEPSKTMFFETLLLNQFWDWWPSNPPKNLSQMWTYVWVVTGNTRCL